MNIAIFSRSTVKHFTSGGMETHLKNLAEGLVQIGNKVSVITTAVQGAKGRSGYEKFTEHGVDYFYINDTTPGLNPITSWEMMFVSVGLMKRTTGGEGGKNYFIESLKVFNELDDKKKFDLVVSQSTVARGILGEKHPPIVSIIHGTITNEIKNRFKANKSLLNWGRFLGIDIPRWYYELLTSNREFFKKVDEVIAVSSDLKKKFLTEHPYCESKTEVIYNGVDSDVFKPGGKKFPVFTILYIGRMEREKGVDLIIKSVHELVKKGLKVNACMIGSGIHLSEFKKITDSLNLNEHVDFLGQIKNEDLVKYYQQSHVFVLPTRREEGHPMTISEAFCCGLPVIATKKGGLAELVEDRKTGFFVNENDYLDLSEKISLLYSDASLLSDIEKATAETGKKKYSRNAMILEYQKVFKSLA